MIYTTLDRLLSDLKDLSFKDNEEAMRFFAWCIDMTANEHGLSWDAVLEWYREEQN